MYRGFGVVESLLLDGIKYLHDQSSKRKEIDRIVGKYVNWSTVGGISSLHADQDCEECDGATIIVSKPLHA